MMAVENLEEKEKPFSGGELDEPQGEGPFSGGELDEPQTHEGTRPVPGNEPEDIEEDYGKKKKRPLFLAVGVCFLVAVGVVFLQKSEIATPLVKRGKVPVEQSLVFGSFVIPFKEHSRFTYITLSVSFTSRDQRLIGELTEKEDQIRGILYDRLRERLNQIQEVPELDQLKGVIISGVNQILSNGKVNDAYIINYLAV